MTITYDMFKKLHDSAMASAPINTQSFIVDNLTTFKNKQYGAFWDGNHQVIVFKRDLTNNQIQTYQTGIYNQADSTVSDPNLHNVIVLAVDEDGYIHLSYDHHNYPLNYRRSNNPEDITSWTAEISMTGQNEGSLTYPTFIKRPSDKELFFLWRDGYSGNGYICINRWDRVNKVWNVVTRTLLDGTTASPTANPYWNRPCFDKLNRLHLSWCWRDDGTTSQGVS